MINLTSKDNDPFFSSDYKFMFGTDPEFVIFENDKPKSAIDILGEKHDKDNKLSLIFKLKEEKKSFFFYDNVMLEINLQAEKSFHEVLSNIGYTFFQLASFLGNKSPYYEFRAISSVNFPASELTSDKAKVFGCDPEYCAYQMQIINPPISTSGFRSAGGHIHIGQTDLVNGSLTNKDEEIRGRNILAFVRMMDLFVGVPSVLIDTEKASLDRRKLYGKAGSFREKPYGVEYRPLSNFWLRSPELVNIIYSLTSFVYNFCEQKNHNDFWREDECIGYDVEMVKTCINECNKDLACQIYNKVIAKILPNNLKNNLLFFIENGCSSYNLYKEWIR